MSALIAKANKALTKIGAKHIYDSKALNLAIGKAIELPKMPVGKNVREWCATNGIVIDVRDIVHENKRGKTSCLRPENTVRERLRTLTRLNKRIAQVSYCRYLVNGTTDATDPTNENAYKVYLFRK